MDAITKIGNSIIHFGKSNNRIYLMSLDYMDLPIIVDQLDRLANENGYTKIIAKVPAYAKEIFENSGYLEEATIPDFYCDKEDICFFSKYLDCNRQTDPFNEYCIQVLEKAKSTKVVQEKKTLDEDICCRKANEKDVEDMALVYQEVFKSYPFPIHDKSYLLKTMQENVIYFGIWCGKQLVALSSIEVGKDNSNAEMTDFATIEAYRGKGYACYLLDEMENESYSMGINTAYTIARAKSYGMNITFAKQGYIYAGTLINNTNIAGHIESMNVWYKSLI
ncbi:MAG: putative beta-lysine N-acetyltransferase [Firmicutes bacterium HGW-Firmicutes-1]|jgi:putative beta-lysine N-acetyltransferase|nr:MAG: putative beta-lysine N-acetyltransferase [Firmicutes bacterium HGW-Firmicutes-1]